jgi:hypothetical protein
MRTRDIVDLMACACVIRGLFVMESYEKTRAVGEVVASGVENPLGQVIGYFGGEWVSAPFIFGFEGARAFCRDAQKLVNKLQMYT